MGTVYDGSITFDTAVDVSGFESGSDKINDTFAQVRKGAESAAEGMGELPDKMNETADSTSRLADIVKGSGAFKLIEKGVNLVVSSLDRAIDRYDTMNRFPQMLQQMGYSAEDSGAAVQRLSAGIQGLPTTLDSVVSTAQRLTVLTGNLDRSVDTTLALNDAFLASGSSSENAARGLEQYVQMLSKGEVDLQSWRTLQETMGLALNQVAESFGFAGESAQNDLYAALQSGEITFEQFNAGLIQLDGSVGGFAALAQTSSTGIKTSWTNLSTGIVRGTAKIVESVDKGLSNTRFKSIQNSIELLGDGAEAVLNTLAPAFEFAAAHADTLTVSVAALTAAYGANKAVTAFTAAQKIAVAAMGAATDAVGVIIPTLDAKTLAEARAAAVAKLDTAATEEQIAVQMASNGVITAKNFALGVLTGKMGLATVASGLLTAATTALKNAINVALGPVGLVTLGLTALAAGAVAVYKAVTAESEACAEQSDILDSLADAQENLAESEKSSAKAAQENLKSIRASASASGALADELGQLASAENKTASQKQRMAELVDQLNEKYADLCLTYDEAGDRLSMNTQQLQDYIAAQQTMDEAAALQARYNELLEEESLIRQNNAELDAKEQELAGLLEQKLISTSEYNDLLGQVTETRAGYLAQEEEIAARKGELDAQLAELDTAAAQTVIDNAAAQQEAAAALAEAEEQEMQRRRDALQSYTDAATDMYDRINTKSKVSVNEMIANLEHNQQAVAAWADNLVALGERGLDQGLLQQLRDAGPESAATVNELVNASDEELARLSEVFRNGSETAVDALRTELGLPEVISAGSDMVDYIADGVNANTSLTEATVQLVEDTRQAAQDAVSSGAFENIGQQMVNGITAGIRAGESGLIAAMRSAVLQALGAAKAEADIHSPSGLFREVIGVNIMRGWALGLQDGEPLVTDSMADSIEDLRTEITRGLDPAELVAAMQNGVIGMQNSIAGALQSINPVSWNSPVAAAAVGGNTYTQYVTFEQPMQAPDEIARALRIQNTYGLAGDY